MQSLIIGLNPGLKLRENVGVVNMVLNRVGDWIVTSLLIQSEIGFVLLPLPLSLHLLPNLFSKHKPLMSMFLRTHILPHPHPLLVEP